MQMGKRLTVWIAAFVCLFGLALLAGEWLTPPAPPTAGIRAVALAARTPTPQPTAAVPGNLLTNPSFEGSFSPQAFGEINIAPGWRAWYLDIPPCKPWRADCYIPCPQNCIEDGECLRDYGCMWARPEFGQITYPEFSYRVHSGESAQKYFSFGRMHEAGLYQRVTGIVPGAPLEFSAWLQAWMCYDFLQCDYGRKSDQPGDMHLRVGIDPAGGTDPASANVVWSPEGNSFDQWAQFTVRATAQSDAVTVFTHSRAEWDFAHANNDVYLDDASLVMTGPPAQWVFRPAQPELGQLTTIQITANYAYANAQLTITPPQGTSLLPGSGAPFGNDPFAWTWQFTPTISGTHSLAFSADALPAPITATLRAVAAARLTAQPSTALIDEPVAIQSSAYYLYPAPQVNVTDPAGRRLALTDEGDSSTVPHIHTWRATSSVAGTHLVTFTADLLPAPLATRFVVTSTARVSVYPPTPPVNAPTTIRASAYVPYPKAVLSLTHPQGQPIAAEYVGQTGTAPVIWTWMFTPTITGTHPLLFTADGLEVPARGQVWVGGSSIYLPVVFKQWLW